ncbi:MarR family winged helix-turn-helix transcriptional regulator [Variovorax sp. YR216]|uniref:MarR family winged helix-turn-helix transcriptional regulator n=1 Tax=Variovorax sp. YR216 TaxID=1882828 RepID=UPI000899A7B3|nr:MarR family transcriptional regulator [Variovorax sp. YR216]SEB14064.1 MarR family transcriptional regulator, transcriptional regulator for hemolysin [Variovorax sp. YR216]
MATPSPEHHRRIGIRLVGLARRWRQALDARLSSAGLSDATWSALVHLHEMGDGVSQSQLAAAAGLDGSSLVRLLDILVGQELVERRPHTSDRRVKLLHLTQAGRRAVTSIRKRLAAIEDELLADIDEEEARVLLRAFEKIESRIAASN